MVSYFLRWGSFRNLSSRVMSFVLGGRDASERGAQALVVEPGDVLDDGELELRAVRQTRSRINSVLKLSKKLSAAALSKASPTVPIDARTPWSSRVWL